MSEFGKRGIRVAAVSVDPVEVSRKFAKKAGITFPLLSDADKNVIRTYDLLHIGGGHNGTDIARPAEFLIDPAGTVRWVNLTDDFRVRAHGDAVLKETDKLGLASADP